MSGYWPVKLPKIILIRRFNRREAINFGEQRPQMKEGRVDMFEGTSEVQRLLIAGLPIWSGPRQLWRP